MNEFSIAWLKGADYAEVTCPNGSALKNKIVKWAEKGKAGVKVVCINKDGSLFAHIPVSFIKVSDRKGSRTFTAEQKAANAKRLADYRARKAAENADTVDDIPFMLSDNDDDDDWELEDDNDSEFYSES